MSQPVDKGPSLELAAQRFRQGMCPGCGKRSGESRGLEYRAKTEDLYCHTCRKSWPVELDMDILRRELATLSPCHADDFPSTEAIDARDASEPRPKQSSGLGKLLRRLLGHQ